jgi:L-ribulose-5-phosphate 4-epimerase
MKTELPVTRAPNFGAALTERLQILRRQVWQSNMDLQKHHLVTFTWGNVSGIDRASGYVVIKPSGVAYEALSPENMVVVDLSGAVIEGELNPSSDTATHLELYRAFPSLGGVVHTHSSYATAWAQAGKPIPALGTTHADYFYGSIPCTRALTDAEIATEYERNTGKVIIETITTVPATGNSPLPEDAAADPLAIPGVIVQEHGPFCWGKSPDQAVHNAVVLETIASMALHTLQINPLAAHGIRQSLLDKHYLRKHGKHAYYGQKSQGQKSQGQKS